MTVDVGWPWWVTAVLAAGIAALCLVAFFVTRKPAVRGVLATLAVQGIVVAAVAPFVMSESGSGGMPGMGEGETPGSGMVGAVPPAPDAPADMPFMFYFTHYELLGNPNSPSGVAYHSNGRPLAQAPDGSTIVMSGAGGWDPASTSAKGGGHYAIQNAAGDVTERGTWNVTQLVSFEQLPGWWGFPNWSEEGWQGPPGSASFSGFLEVRARFSGRGDGLLTAWCLMSGVEMPPGHTGDGITVTGPHLDFTQYRRNEASLEGVMFYGR